MSKVKVGLQLFSVRDKMSQDFEGTLKAVKNMGYDCVEFAGYFEKSSEEIRKILDDLGLECASVHQTPEIFITEGQPAVDFLKGIGAKYCALPWLPKETLKTDFDKIIDTCNKAGKILKDNGIQLLYHNHDFEYETIDGECIIDKIYRVVPAEYLQPEFDTCWIKYAGYEPVEYLKKYSGRIDVVHLKDFICKELGSGPVYSLIDKSGKEVKSNSKEERGFKFRPVGSGMQDIPAIAKASIEAGAKYLIVEQDNWYDDDSLELAKQSREYLKSIGY